MERKISVVDNIENLAWKEAIAHYKQLLLFPQVVGFVKVEKICM